METTNSDQINLFDDMQPTLPESQPSHPDMTPEQEAHIDRLVDNQGFNYHQAKLIAGVTVVAETVEKPVQTALPKTSAHSRPRRPLSNREKAAADREWPAHIKRW